MLLTETFEKHLHPHISVSHAFNKSKSRAVHNAFSNFLQFSPFDKKLGTRVGWGIMGHGGEIGHEAKLLIFSIHKSWPYDPFHPFDP